MALSDSDSESGDNSAEPRKKAKKMAAQITQETFDAAVQENMEVFEMNEEEALAEAIQQFEAQGVNLDTIVKESKTTSASSDKHEVITATEALREWVESSNNHAQVLEDACTTFREACDKNLAERCLAAKNGAYTVLMSALEKASSHHPQLLTTILQSLHSFITGQPDLLDDAGTSTLLQLLQSTDGANTALVLCVLRQCCLLHEGNRQRFVAQGIIGTLAKVLKERRSDSEVVKSACAVLKSLTLDDDVRVPFGKSYDHAKLIVDEADGLRLLLELASAYEGNADVLPEIFQTISRLAVRDEFCCQVLDLGGIKKILTILSVNLQHQSLECSLLGLLKTLAGSDPVKVEIIKEGGVEVIVEVLNKYIRNATICDVGCATVAALVLRFPAHSAKVMESGTPDLIIKSMQLHPKLPSVQKSACMAIRNLVSRCPENNPVFLELGAERLLEQVMSSHKDCRDEAKAALRDLGCHVELTELWKGTGKTLEQ